MQLLRFFSFISVFCLSYSSQVLYSTVGTITDPYSNPLSGLLLNLSYPTIPLNLTNSTSDNGSFSFSFSYDEVAMLTGTLVIHDPLSRFSDLSVEVDNYLGTAYICDLGVLKLAIKNISAEVFGGVFNSRGHGIDAVYVNMSYFLSEKLLGQSSTQTNQNGSYNFSGLELESMQTYVFTLSFSRLGYMAANTTVDVVANSSMVNLTETILKYVLRKGKIDGRVVFAGTKSGAPGVSVSFWRWSAQNNNITYNKTVISVERGYFRAEITGILEIYSSWKVNMSLGNKTYGLTLFRKMNYSLQLGDLVYEKESQKAMLNVTGTVKSLGNVSNATVLLFINNSEMAFARNRTISDGSFVLIATVPLLEGIENVVLLTVVARKRGFSPGMANCTMEIDKKGLNVSVGTIEMQEKQHKNRTVDGKIIGRLAEYPTNGSISISSGDPWELEAKYANTTREFLMFGPEINITIKGLRLETEVYNVTVRIRVKSFKLRVFEILLLKSSNFTSNFTVFELFRKRHHFSLNVQVILGDWSGFQPIAIAGKLQIFQEYNGNNSRSFYNSCVMVQAIQELVFLVVLYEGVDYPSIISIESRFYETSNASLVLSLSSGVNSSYVSLFLARKRAEAKVEGLIRDSVTLNRIRNVNISLVIGWIVGQNSKEYLYENFKSKNGTFKMSISRENILKGELYSLKICFIKKNYSLKCLERMLNERNHYFQSFNMIFMMREMLNITLTATISNREAIGMLFSGAISLYNGSTLPWRETISENGSLVIKGVRLIKGNSVNLTFFIKETSIFGLFLKNITIKALFNQTIVVALGEISLWRKSIDVAIGILVVNRPKVNIMKKITISEVSEAIYEFESMDLSPSLMKHMNLSLFRNYTITTTATIANSNITAASSINVSCPYDPCESFIFPLSFSLFNVTLQVCGTFEAEEASLDAVFADIEAFESNLSRVFTKKHVFIGDGTRFSIDFQLQTYNLPEYYLLNILLNTPGFENTILPLKLERNTYSFLFENCSQSQNILLLTRKRLVFRFFGVLQGLNDSLLYYIQLKTVDSGTTTSMGLLTVLADGIFNYEAELEEQLGYLLWILVKKEEKEQEIVFQTAFFIEEMGKSNVFYKDSVKKAEIYREINVNQTENKVFIRIQGQIRANNSNETLYLARVNLSQYGLVALSDKNGTFLIQMPFSSQNLSFSLIFELKNYQKQHQTYNLCGNSNKSCEYNLNISLQSLFTGLNVTIITSKSRFSIEKWLLLVNGSQISINSSTNTSEITLFCNKCLLKGATYNITLVLTINDTFNGFSFNKTVNFTATDHGKGYLKLIKTGKMLNLKGFVAFYGKIVEKTTGKPVKVPNLRYFKWKNNGTRAIRVGLSGFFSVFLMTNTLFPLNLTVFIRNSRVFEDFEGVLTAFSNGTTLEITRKTSEVLFSGFVSHLEANRTLENATVRLFTEYGIYNNVSMVTNSSGWYNLTISAYISLRFGVIFEVSCPGYKEISKNFTNVTIFRTNSSFFIDFWLENGRKNVTIWLDLLTNKTLDAGSMIEVFVLSGVGPKKNKKLLFFQRNLTVTFNTVLAYNLSVIEMFVRCGGGDFESGGFNVSLPPNTTTINETFLLHSLNSSFVPIKAVFTGLFAFYSEFYYDCGDQAGSAATLQNGSFSVSFQAQKGQTYLCFLTFEGFPTAFHSILNRNNSYRYSFGNISCEKPFKLLQISLKLLSLLPQQRFWALELFLIKEGPPEKSQTFTRKVDSYGGTLVPWGYVDEFLVRRETLYRLDVFLKGGSNITMFIRSGQKKITMFALPSLIFATNYTIEAEDIGQNDVIVRLFMMKSGDFLGVFVGSAWNLSLFNERRRFLLGVVFQRSGFRDLQAVFLINQTESEVKVDLSKMLALEKLALLVVILKDFGLQVPILVESFTGNMSYMTENGSNITVRNKLKGNSFGFYLLELKIAQLGSDKTLVLLNISAPGYDFASFGLNCSNVYVLFLNRTFVFREINTNLTDLFNFSSIITNFKAQTNSSDLSLATSTGNNSDLMISGSFPANLWIPIYISVSAEGFKAFNKTIVLSFSYILLNSSLSIDSMVLTPENALAEVSFSLNLTNISSSCLLNYSFLTYDGSSPQNSTQIAISTSPFTFNLSLDPTQSPFLFFLTLNNTEDMPLSLSFMLSFANRFRKYLGLLAFTPFPTISITVLAEFYDQELSDSSSSLVPINGVNVTIDLVNSNTNATITSWQYNGSNSSFKAETTISEAHVDLAQKYKIILYAEKFTLVPYNTSKGVVLRENLTANVNFSTVYLDHKLKSGFLAGYLVDNLTISGFLADETISAIITCTNSGDITMVQIITDSNGLFNITMDVYDGFNYSVLLEATLTNYDDLYLTVYLDVSNDYRLNLDNVTLFREKVTGGVSGSLQDSFSGMAVRGFLVIVKIENVGNYSAVVSNEYGQFSMQFAALSGLSYNVSITYPLQNMSNSTNTIYVHKSVVRRMRNHKTIHGFLSLIETEEESSNSNNSNNSNNNNNSNNSNISSSNSNNNNNSFYAIENIFNLTLNSTNAYTLALGKLVCQRLNTSALVSGSFVGNFTSNGSFFVILNLTAGSSSLIFTQELTFSSQRASIDFIFRESVPKAMNYTADLSISSDVLDLESTVVFLLNDENGYTYVLGNLTLTAIGIRFIISGVMLDSSSGSFLTNVTVTVQIMVRNSTFKGNALSDTTGNFTVTIKLPFNTFDVNTGLGIMIYGIANFTKTFYESKTVNFSINSTNFSYNEHGKCYNVDLGSVSLVPSYSTGSLAGIIIDAVSNEYLGEQTVTISIYGSSDASLISINLLTTNSTGGFQITFSVEKSMSYYATISVALDSSIYDSCERDVELNALNNYTNNSVRLFVVRKTAELVIKAIIVDNSTKKPVDSCQFFLRIQFNRTENCLIYGSNSTECSDLSIFLKNHSIALFDGNFNGTIVFSNRSIQIDMQNKSDASGSVTLKVYLWLGLDYSLSLNFEKNLYHVSTYNETISFQSTTVLNLGLYALVRLLVIGYMSGYVLDLDFAGIVVFNANVTIILTSKEIQGFIGLQENTLTGNETGYYELKFEGLEAGLEYFAEIMVEAEFFNDFDDSGVGFEYNNNIDAFLLERNVSMVRKHTDVAINGSLVSNLTNQTIAKARISGEYQVLKEYGILSNVSSDENGTFCMKYTAYQGFLYNFTLEFNVYSPYLSNSLNFLLFMANSSLSYNVGTVMIDTQKVMAFINGFIYDTFDKEGISNVSIRTKLFDMNNSTAEIARKAINSSKNGSFSLTFEVFLAEDYEILMLLKALFFESKLLRSYYLNETLNYTLNMNVNMRRVNKTATIDGNCIDGLTSQELNGVLVRLQINNTRKNVSADNNGNFELNFTAFLGKTYLGEVFFWKTYYDTKVSNVSLDLLNNYTLSMGNVSLMRKTATVYIEVMVIDNLTLLGVGQANVSIEIKQLNMTLTGNTNDSGFLSTNVSSIYEGIPYNATITVTNDNFASYEQYIDFTALESSELVAVNITLFHKMSNFTINGVVESEEDTVISNASIVLNISLNTSLEIPVLSFHINTSKKGVFTITGAIPMFNEVNCSLKVSKKGYQSWKKVFELEKSQNFTKTLNITLESSNSGESGTIGLPVSTEKEVIELQVVSRSCGIGIIYIANATVELKIEGKVMAEGATDSEGMCALSAPLVFYGDSSQAASYEGEVVLDKEGFFENTEVVTVGGSDWMLGLNLGQIELIAKVC